MKRSKYLDLLLAGIPAALYLSVVSATIGKWSIWFDEAFSAYLMKFSIPGIFHYTSADVHPPLYYVLLKFWTELFGTSDVALRSMSAVVITAAIVVAYFFLKTVYGRRVAFVAAIMLSLSPMLVRFGQEARMYGLVVLISVLATWLLYEINRRPTRNRWIAYAVLVALGMWTHYFTALVWLAHWAWRALQVRSTAKSSESFRKKFFSRAWVRTHLLAIGLFLPWLPFMAIQLGSIQGNGFWIRAVDVDTLTDYVTTNLLFLKHYEAVSWLAVLTIIAVLLTGYLAVRVYPTLRKRQREMLLLMGALAIIPPVLLFISSLPPLRPSFIDRYLLAASFWLIAGAGVVAALGYQRNRTLSIMLGSVLVVSMLIGTGNVYRIGNFNRESWETMAIKDVVYDIHQRDTDETPIVTDTSWRFYEAIQYDIPSHPTYFTDSRVPYGSYNMLRDSDFRKIKDTEAFYSQNPEFWYIGIYHDDTPRMPRGDWQVIDSVKGPQTFKNSGTAYAYKLKAQ